MEECNKPPARDFKAVSDYIHRKVLENEESKFIRGEDDSIRIRGGREHAWLVTAIERIVEQVPYTLAPYLVRPSPCSRVPEIDSNLQSCSSYPNQTQRPAERWCILPLFSKSESNSFSSPRLS